MKWKESTDHNERLHFFDDGTAIIIRYSPLTGKFNKAMMQITEEQYYNWKNGSRLIQEALSHLDKDEREFLKTGYTPDDWKKIFPPKEEENQ